MFWGNQQFLGIFSVADAGTDFKVGNPLHTLEARMIRAVATVLEPLTPDTSMSIKFKREAPDGSIQSFGTTLTIDSSVAKGQQVRKFYWIGFATLYDSDILIVNITTSGSPTQGKVALWASFVARR